MRKGVTLVELLLVIGIMLLLTAMTVGALRLNITTERTRGAARQIQSLIEGARDRAIYAKEPRGIRILVNESITEPVAGKDINTMATTIVYIGSPGEDASQEDIADIDDDGDTSELVTFIIPNDFTATAGMPFITGVGTRWAALYEQGLIGPGTRLHISPYGLGDARTSSDPLRIDPRSFPIQRESQRFGGDANGNGTDDEVLQLVYESVTVRDRAANATKSTEGFFLGETWAFVMETNPDILPGEQPSVLPRNTCIDLQASKLPEGWLRTNADGTQQYSSRMDLLFAPNGAIIGRPGAAGLIHLCVRDIGDAIVNTLPGSPTTPSGEPREGDEFGATIFTRSGRVNVHPVDDPADPWRFGREGELAR